jgi:hypothetical protein
MESLKACQVVVYGSDALTKPDLHAPNHSCYYGLNRFGALQGKFRN